ncbi:hypothetical protein ACJX0J_017670, partial [Zea mays]
TTYILKYLWKVGHTSIYDSNHFVNIVGFQIWLASHYQTCLDFRYPPNVYLKAQNIYCMAAAMWEAHLLMDVTLGEEFMFLFFLGTDGMLLREAMYKVMLFVQYALFFG